MAIERYYDPDKNPNGRARLPGVPLRDLTTDDWANLTKRQQESVDASDIYRKTKPASAKATKKASAKAGAAAPADDPPATAEDLAVTTEEGQSDG
jgi:hypothetical protein